MMSKKAKRKAWAIQHPGGFIYLNTVQELRRDAIAAFLEGARRPWSDYRDFKAIKVEVVQVEEPMEQLTTLKAKITRPDDIARMRRVLQAAGYDANDSDLQLVYAEWSEDMYCAGWLSLPKDDADLLRLLLTIFGVDPVPTAHPDTP